ncbi:MAG: hypothetical protein QXU69_03055 [Thermofilaceae archaeon]
MDMEAAVYRRASCCGDIVKPVNLETKRMMKSTIIGAVKVPITIENIQLGPKGAVNTPMKLIAAENTARRAQSLGVRMLLISAPAAVVLIKKVLSLILNINCGKLFKSNTV